MKFCYVDESESARGGVVVAAGVIVDGTRMHLTKSDWAGLLATMGARLGRQLREFKASDLYQGSGPWHGMAGTDRGQVIEDVLTWIARRRHAVAFSGVASSAFDGTERSEPQELLDTWCVANAHIMLAVQRAHQRLDAPKGHTVVVLDRGRHEQHLVDFVRSPPSWTDAYYDRRRRGPLDQIVDVPYFVDSAHAVLVQTADLFAYILRRYVELSDLGDGERYRGEQVQIGTWARALAARSIRPHLWPTANRTAAHTVFRELAPPSLVALRP